MAERLGRAKRVAGVALTSFSRPVSLPYKRAKNAR